MVDNYREQAPPSLTFASPLAKLNSANFDQELLICFHASKVHICWYFLAPLLKIELIQLLAMTLEMVW
jgi:hypothetical protein